MRQLIPNPSLLRNGNELLLQAQERVEYDISLFSEKGAVANLNANGVS